MEVGSEGNRDDGTGDQEDHSGEQVTAKTAPPQQDPVKARSTLVAALLGSARGTPSQGKVTQSTKALTSQLEGKAGTAPENTAEPAEQQASETQPGTVDNTTNPQEPEAVACAATDEVQVEQQKQLLKDIEDHCATNGRHPAEWDNLTLQWVDSTAPAVPYFPVSDRLMKPLRPREVICELLACGLPVSPTAHTALNNLQDYKAFVRAAKRLIAAGRPKTGIASHVSAAVERGIIDASCLAFVNEAKQAILGVKFPAAHEALSSVAAKHPDMVDTIQLMELEKWLAEMSLPEYQTAVNVHTQMQKLISKGAANSVAGGSSEENMGIMCEKLSQYLSNLYHQEVKAAKARIDQGKPPQPMELVAASPEGVTASSTGQNHPEPSSSPRSIARSPFGSAAQRDAAHAMLNMLQMLPKGSQLGYKNAAGWFVPLMLSNLEVQHGPPEPCNSVENTPRRSQVAKTDIELMELQAVYQHVIWNPDKAMVQELSWTMNVEASSGEAPERNEETLKKATQRFTPPAITKLRQEHYGQESVRQMLREVSLLVLQRIRDTLLIPAGNPKKTVSGLKVKIASIDLPPRDSERASPATFLLDYASRQEANANNSTKRSREPSKAAQADATLKKQKAG